MSESIKREKEFEILFRENYSRLYYYALDWVEDEDVAKDLVSELFGDLWAQYSQWSPDNSKAYLNRAIRNRCLNYLKYKANEQNMLQAYIEEKKAVIDSDTSSQEELMKRVEEVMDSLSPKTRFIVEQCYIGGKKYSEFAVLMDTTSGMVHKHISKALALFRKILEVKRAEKGTDKLDKESL